MLAEIKKKPNHILFCYLYSIKYCFGCAHRDTNNLRSVHLPLCLQACLAAYHGWHLGWWRTQPQTLLLDPSRCPAFLPLCPKSAGCVWIWWVLTAWGGSTAGPAAAPSSSGQLNVGWQGGVKWHEGTAHGGMVLTAQGRCQRLKRYTPRNQKTAFAMTSQLAYLNPDALNFSFLMQL